MRSFARIFQIFLAATLFLLALPVNAQAGQALTAYKNYSADETEDFADLKSEVLEKNFSVDSALRAVVINPDVDFPATDTDKLSELLDKALEIGLDTVIMPMYANGRALFSDKLYSDGDDGFSAIIDTVRAKGMRIYARLDLAYLLAEKSNADFKSSLISSVHAIAVSYRPDAFIVSGYYALGNAFSREEYAKSGSGIGFSEWLFEQTQSLAQAAAEAVRKTNNTIPIGIYLQDVWANKSEDFPLGSETKAKYQAVLDGFTDTKRLLKSGSFDFALVNTPEGTDGEARPFEELISWWGENSFGVPLYALHNNAMLADGWGEDQLLRQLSLLKDNESFKGSAFSSLSALVDNPNGTTDTLKKYFAEQINEESLFDDLEMVSPTKLSYSTYEPEVKFMGTFDPNFDVYFNGEKIELNSAGNFYIQKELEVGENVYTIKHKSKTYTYRINRNVKVLESVEPVKNLSVDGGTKLVISAIAYKGSTVYAEINGTTIKLKQSSASTDDVDINSAYRRFVGKYKLPDGIIGEKQKLGKITVSAEYKGIYESAAGASVTINAEPEPPKIDAPEIIIDQSNVGTGEVVGTVNPTMPKGTATYIRVLNNFTSVFDAKTTDRIPTPDFGQLPAGTIDYYKDTSGDYYISTSGKRYNIAETELFDSAAIQENRLVVKSVGTSGGEAYIQIGLDFRTSFNIQAEASFHEGADGDFEVYSFDANTVTITFDNVTSITKLPDFDKNAVFSAGKWETVTEDGIPKFRMVLTLRQSGIYAGTGAYYDENGDLMLKFKPTYSGLSGKVIAIDPGHNYAPGTSLYNPGAVSHVVEAKVNYEIALLLEKRLTELGATVVRLETDKYELPIEERAHVARQYGADLFISLHSNSAAETVQGVEAYYFTPYSQPLAELVSASLSSYYENSVYKDGESRNRGAKYSYYWVTLQQDFPSILLEMGFVSNYEEAMVLSDSAHQKKIAEAIADGISAYFARSGLSYIESGSEDVPASGDIPAGGDIVIE